jgi:hypothetical protein
VAGLARLIPALFPENKGDKNNFNKKEVKSINKSQLCNKL